MASEINASGDWAYEMGDYTALISDESGGKYLHIWKKTPEGWQLCRDIWN